MTKAQLKLLMLAFLPLLFFISTGFADAQNGRQPVHQHERAMPLTKALKDVSKVFDTKFVYEKSLLAHKTTTYDMKDIKGKPLEDILKNLLYPQGLVFLYVKHNYYTIVSKDRLEENKGEAGYKNATDDSSVVQTHHTSFINQPLQAIQSTPRNTTVKGEVTDEDGTPLAGVSVNVKTSSNTGVLGAITNEKGEYSLELPDNAIELRFSYLGMKTVSEDINGRSVINVQLSSENAQLKSVVVTALGIKRQTRSLSYSQQGVDISTMTEAPTTNFISALSGRVAGVDITPPSTNTGSARIVIRGNKSITGNNQPLFVIDGIPVDNGSNDQDVRTSGSEGLDYGNVLATISPEDIQSIQVLKGPNAAALYGSQAANGAILITTKKSDGEGFKVTVNSNTTFQRIREFPDIQNTYGAGSNFKLEGSGSTNNPQHIPDLSVFSWSWGAPMLGQPVIGRNGKERTYIPQPGNINGFYQTAALITNSVAIDGGNKQNSYRLSYTNFVGNSIVAKLNKNTKNNIDFRLVNNFTDWLHLDSKLAFSKNTVSNRQHMNGSYRNPIYQYVYMQRSVPLSDLTKYKDENANELGAHGSFLNPFWTINEDANKDSKDQLISSFNLSIDPVSWLTIMGKLGTQMYWWNGMSFVNKGGTWSPMGNMMTFNRSLHSYHTDFIVKADKKFGNLFVTVLAGAARYKSNFSDNRQQISSLIQPGLMNLSNSSDYPTVSQNNTEEIINSVYGDITLGYKDFLYMDITGRNDWSSTLPRNNDSYFYPSVGGTFVFSDALKLPKNILSFGKVRASFAQVGNDTKPYQLQPVYSFGDIYNGQALASYSSTLFNPDLKPEQTSSFEYGADLRFFKDRLTINYSHYHSATTNQIITAQVTPASGFEQMYFNAGRIDNWGNELTVGVTALKSQKVSWNILMNFARNRSLVKSLVDSVTSFQLGSYYGRAVLFAEVGQPYDIIRGAGWKRDAAGHKLVGSNGEPLTVPNTLLGSVMPDWTGGITNEIHYKNFDLSFLIDIRSGGIFYSGTYRRELTAATVATTLEGRDDYYLHYYIYGEDKQDLRGGFIYKDAYFENGKPNNIYISPQTAFSHDGGANDEFDIFNATYVKLREVVFGYSLSKELLRKTPFSDLKVALSGRNIWCIYKAAPRGIDPQSSVTSGNGQGIEYGALPPEITYGINVLLTFKK